jgi:hypothetical protein
MKPPTSDTPHVFLCWAHADGEQVLQDVDWLVQHGVHVWYDEGIRPGAEWREELGDAISTCRLFLYFVTPASIASPNCRRELNFALEQDRPILAVHLEETALSDGIRLSLNDRQAILRYAETERTYRDKLLNSVEQALQLEPSDGRSSVGHRRPRRRRRWRRTAVVVVAAATLAGLGGWYLKPLPAPAGEGMVSFELAVKPMPAMPWHRQIGVSHDGRRIAYVQPDGTHVRELGTLKVRVLRGFDAPHFSPDDDWLAFNAYSRVPVNGGTSEQIGPTQPRQAGATFIDESTLVFADPVGLHRLPLSGGPAELLIAPDAGAGERAYGLPCALPGGRQVLFTIAREAGTDAALLDLETLKYRVIAPGVHSARYVGTGHLVFARGTAMEAVRFDVHTLETEGEPVDLGLAVMVTRGGAQFDVSESGTLVYVPLSRGHAAELVWVDRLGHETPLHAPPQTWVYPRISPDGRYVASDVFDADGRNIVVWDLERGTLWRLTDSPTDDFVPTWSADGRDVYFASERTGVMNIHVRAFDAATPVRRLRESPHWQNPFSVSPDGRQLFVTEDKGEQWDIAVVDLARPETVRSVIATGYAESHAQVSPDGRWLVYSSDMSGELEIYVRPWPDVKRRLWKVSPDGGRHPLWSPQGDELYFLDGNGDMQAARWSATPEFEITQVTELFAGSPYVVEGGARVYDVSPVDGRFLMIRKPEAVAETQRIVVTVNWQKELERLLPAS